MKIQKAAVVGAGTMGSGIAQVLSSAGMEVLLKDVSQEFVDRGLANIKRMYDSRVTKGTLNQTEADYLLGNVKGAVKYSDFADVDLVIEAALETIEVKKEIFIELDKHCPARTILASNTSALSISELANYTKRPTQVLGMHFFNPAQVMKLVEVIPGIKTSKKTVEIIIDLCRELNKVPVKVEECPGFLVNRLLFPYLNEALYVLQEKQVTCQQIDETACQFGLPMGPFTLFDLTGIDVCAQVTEFLFSQYGLRFQPNPILQIMVEKKFLGQKSKCGFFVHPSTIPDKIKAKEVNQQLVEIIEQANKQRSPVISKQPFNVYRLILPMFNEALYAIQEKVAQAQDVDVAMQWGCGLTRGLISLAQEKGLDWCLFQMESYQQIHGERYRPAWFLKKLVRAGVYDLKSLDTELVSVT